MPLRSDSQLEDLLEEYRDGSTEAFEIFFRKTKNVVYAYVRRRVNNTETAQDITQEIFLRIHRYVVTFEREKGNAMSWVRSIAQNSLIDYFTQQKSRNGQPDAQLFHEINRPEDLNDRLYYEDMIFQFRGYLSPDELEILIERLIADTSFKDIGLKQGIRTDLARQKFSRVLKKIRKILQ